MFSIARYQVYEQYRALERARRFEAAHPLSLFDGTAHDQGRLEAQRVSLALAQLPIIFREVLRLAYYEELDSFQIAKRLGIPALTVRSRQRRALMRLRKAIGPLDQSVHGADR